MANKDIVITEKDLLARVDEMCAESLAPDIYGLWADEVVPRLKKARQALKGD